MIYLYAYTNFKDGLDSLRRVKVIYDNLKQEGKECEILVNEYRAQLLGKEWGLPLATTIETIKDIDAVATQNDTIIIDSPELLEGKVLNYPNKFKKVIYLNSRCEEIEFEGATIIDIYNKDSIVAYKSDTIAQNNKTIFIYGDSDYEKVLLDNLETFKDKNLDLYWGIYFFIKYEDKLKSVFNEIVESQEYYELFSQYEYFITSSIQVALDAINSGNKVLFLELKELTKCQKNLLLKLKIDIVKTIPEDIKRVNLINTNNIINNKILFNV